MPNETMYRRVPAGVILVLFALTSCAAGSVATEKTDPAPDLVPGKQDVLPVIEGYLRSVRSWDRTEMIRYLSRRYLEVHLSELLPDQHWAALKRRQMLAFQGHGAFAGSCAGKVKKIMVKDGLVLVDFSSKAGSRRTFSLVKEGGEFRIDFIGASGNHRYEDTDVDFDFCDIPISEKNPAVLMEGEEALLDIEKRLGIPPREVL